MSHAGLDDFNGDCSIRRKLAEEFAIATRLYAEAVADLAKITHLSQSSGVKEIHDLFSRVEQAQRRSEAIGRAFKEHIDQHRCAGDGTL